MKCWTPIVVFASLWLAVLAAYSNADIRQLLAAKGSNGVLEVDEHNYEQFLEGHRDYHLVLYMASDSPQFNCILCREVHPVFDTVADSWQRAFPQGFDNAGENLYFLSAEFLNSKTLFQKMQLDSIPKIFHFPPTSPLDKPNAWLTKNDQYQFYAGDHTQMLKQWITSITNKLFDIYVKVNYVKMFMNGAIAFAVVMLLRKFSHYLSALVTSSFVWGSLSLVLILIFLAGYMFNQIRGTPFVRENGDQVEYFAPSAQMQYGLETQVISTVYGLLAMLFVLLVNRVSSIKNAKVQFFAVILVSGLVYLVYGLYLFVFAQKYKGYPFTLLNLPAP
ncbi:CIC11C00000001328 [Sungouiella intermedia]|uniref:CIC11C00000001328 n=1 Tax=Sungouiella intermedia TaxID=45354 RepID=A0A1L0G7B8_9ASCO|nr:CIC11C00000001328 [[Candida] intermedia]